MLHRSLIDGRPVNINDIHKIYILQSPIFTGISKHPRLVIRKLEDGSDTNSATIFCLEKTLSN